MAVEAQMRAHNLLDWTVLSQFEEMPFRFNFLHDLESILWMLLWYFLNYIPSAFDTSRVDETDVRELDGKRERLFACKSIHVPADRMTIITSWDLLLLSRRMKKWRWYDTVLPLVECIVEVGMCLQEAYQNVEKQIPEKVVDGVPRWSAKQFTDEPYVKIQQSIQKALGQLSEGAHAAVSIGVLVK